MSKAEKLYQLLKEDSKDCFDVSVELDDDVVTYEDQCGTIEVDFENRTIKLYGHIGDMFGAETKSEVAEYSVNDNTIELEFYKSEFGSDHASITNKYESDEKLKIAMSECGAYRYLDLDSVFAQK